jgi:predicted alpha/beta superfamily hydrolase
METQKKKLLINGIGINMNKLIDLIEKLKDYKMPKEEQKQQKISFVYGNCAFENKDITIDMVKDNCE